MKIMSPDNPAQILTTHDLSNLRNLQSATTATIPATTFGNNNSSNNSSNIVFSTIPLDGHALLIQQQPQLMSAPQQQQQQQHPPQRTAISATTTATTTNGLRITNGTNNNLGNLLSAATKATILNTNQNNSVVAATTNSGSNKINSNRSNNMPATSKYVFLQQNGNGQFTTYEGTATSNGTNVGNIVLLATEPMEFNGSGNNGVGINNGEQHHVIATATGTGDDEDLRSLTWLNNSNLIKDIVTTSATASGNNKRSIGNNICIINASNAQDLIEELPQHVAGEEHVATTISSNPTELADTQITTLSVSDFQQQFIASSKRFGNIIAAGSNGNGNSQQLNALANFALAQQDGVIIGSSAAATTTTTTSTAARKDDQQQQQQQQHIFSNIPAIGATTTVHVGPSGTTTVVEYKSNANFLPTQRQLNNSHNNNSGNNNNNNSNVAASNIVVAAAGGAATNTTTITATNLSNNNNHNKNNNNYVPSTISTSTASSNHVPASSVSVSACTAALPAIAKQLTLPSTIVTTTNNSNNSNVTNGNSTTNTIYQGQQQKQQNANNNGGIATTSHHPHKKYLREKMNVLVDHGGGGGGGGGGVGSSIGNNASTITVVSSPASSTNSLSSSSSSTSSSTAAVNGGNSPVSKSFYALGGGAAGGIGNPATIAINYSNNSSNSSSSAFVAAVSTASPSASTANSPLATGIPAYTIINQSQNVVSSSPVVSSPEPSNSKEFYMLSTPQQHQHQQQQLHQQQQHQQNIMRSPISYSSYDNDSLKDFDISTTNSSMSGARHNSGTPQHHHNHQQQQPTTPKSSANTHNNNASSSASNSSNTPQKQKHPNNVPYDPLVHTHNKPPYSFSSLIFMAIENSNEKALPVKEIYAWIVQHFPYFKTAPTGWKNSVRHNLSLNKSFVKVEKAPNMGKGSLWRVEHQQRQNLIQALTRSPFFPNSAVERIAIKSPGMVGVGGNAGINNAVASSSSSYDTIDGGTQSGSKAINQRFDPRLFPKVSKAFKDMSEHNMLSDVVAEVPDDEIPSDYSTTNQSNNHNHNNNNNNNNNKHSSNSYSSSSIQTNSNGNGNANMIGSVAGGGSGIMGAFNNYESIERLARVCGADSIDDVNAATAMLALKHGPKVFAETFQNGAPVITSSPSEDHTYSAGGSAAGSGASTPLTNGNANNTVNGNGLLINGQQNGCDNQSNCASSDAAYESSEENHNITPEELEDQQRHRDGVDALLSLSLSSVIDSSTSCSPVKRPPSTSTEEEHISACMDNNGSITGPTTTATQPQNHVGKMTLLNNGTTVAATVANVVYTTQSTHHHHHQQQQQQQLQQPQEHHSILDEGYNTQSYYGSNANHHHHNLHHLPASPSPPKKPKQLRTNLRTKFKRKTPWMR